MAMAINIKNPLEIPPNLFDLPITAIGTIDHIYFSTQSVQMLVSKNVGSDTHHCTTFMHELAAYKYIGDSGDANSLNILQHLVSRVNMQRTLVLNALSQKYFTVIGPLQPHLQSKIRLAQASLEHATKKISDADYNDIIKSINQLSI